MRIFGGYILRQIAATGGIAILIMLIAFVLERTLRLIRDVGLSALTPELAVGLILCRVPEILAIILPPAFFAGLLLTYQRLVRDSEMDAIYASGLGFVHMARPLLLLTAVVAALSLVLLWFLLPQGKFYFRMLMNEATQNAFTSPFKTGTFIQFQGKVLYIDAKHEDAERPGSFFFYEPGENGEKFVTIGDAGEFGLSGDGRNLFLAAYEGQRVSIPEPARESTLLTFDHVQKLIYSFEREDFRGRGEYVSELMPRELFIGQRIGQRPPRDPDRSAQMRALFHIKLARVLLVFLLPLAAVPLALCFPPSRHWLGIAIGAALVLALDQGLIFGETVVGGRLVSPWLGIWGVLACFAAIGALLTVVAARRPLRGQRALR